MELHPTTMHSIAAAIAQLQHVRQTLVPCRHAHSISVHASIWHISNMRCSVTIEQPEGSQSVGTGATGGTCHTPDCNEARIGHITHAVYVDMHDWSTSHMRNDFQTCHALPAPPSAALRQPMWLDFPYIAA